MVVAVGGVVVVVVVVVISIGYSCYYCYDYF